MQVNDEITPTQFGDYCKNRTFPDTFIVVIWSPETKLIRVVSTSISTTKNKENCDQGGFCDGISINFCLFL